MEIYSFVRFGEWGGIPNKLNTTDFFSLFCLKIEDQQYIISKLIKMEIYFLYVSDFTVVLLFIYIVVP